MKVVVTGATGFIGSRLCLRCADAGMSVLALGRRAGPIEQQNAAELETAGVELREVLVDDRDALAAALAGADRVFHLAAAQHEANVPDAHFHAVNVEGTRNIFLAAQQAGVGRVVHGSTIGVYGEPPEGPIRNDSPLEPVNIYGVTKLLGEDVVKSFADQVPAAIARIAETYGPGDRRLLKLFKGAEQGVALQIGNGRNLHHLVHVDDLCDGLLAAAREDAAVGRTFVLAGREPVTTRQMLEAVARALGREPRILRVPMAPLMLTAAALEGVLRPLGIQPPLHRRRMDFFRRSFAFSLDEASALGYKPRVGLDEGMRSAARWYAQQGLLRSTPTETP
jgi:nucleoside-diphosphate-sugar epimerase